MRRIWHYYAVTFSMMNRIVLGDKKLGADYDQILLAEEGQKRVGIIIDRRNGLGHAEWLRLEGGGFETAEEARDAGMLWRNLLSVSFAKAGIAADFDPWPLPSRNSDDMAEIPDAPGLVVYPVKPGLAGRVLTWAELEGSKPLDLFIENDLQPVRALIPTGLDRRLELAYSLVHLAMVNTNADTEYILWVTAVEALISDDKPDRADEEVVEYLKQLAQQVHDDKAKFNRKIRQRVEGILKFSTQETITEMGKSLARNLSGQYDGKTAEGFFVECYEGRSNLVHGNIQEGKRPSPREIRRVLPELKRFVLELLDSELAIAGQ
jgi:hypothetical protein